LARQFVGISEYFNEQNGGDTEDYLGANKYFFDSHAQIGYQLLAHGLTDCFSVGLSGSYISFDADFRYPNGATKSLSDTGGIISVGATYRVLDQNEFPFDVDFSAVVRTGNAPLRANIAVGYKVKRFTIQGVLGANQFNDGSYTAQPEEVPAWIDATRRYYAAIRTQTRVTNSFSFNVNLRYSAPASSVDAVKAGIPYTIRFAETMGAGLSLNYHFIADKLVGQLGYNMQKAAKNHEQYADPVLNTTQEGRDDSSFSVGLLYAF
jgi:hypothetical protein